ncbi:hypothetical protein EDD85DRAFT_856471 [Armillaria nabsnona]|nr:hypothetical protein EDD85DRAFT_856471 [Armillaria nabsnona]
MSQLQFAPFSSDLPQRPTMRRKSSAQNLLSSFKNPVSGNSSGPTPLNTAVASFSSTVAAPTPTTTTPMAREWDAQSLHSESVGVTTALNQGTSVELLRDLMQKRIITLTYVRNMHEGRSHWFHTIYISKADLEREFNNEAMKKRTHRFAILGMSLSNLLDINQPQDLLRGLINTLNEYDQSKEDSDKSKIRQPKRLFRRQPGKRQGNFAEYSGSVVDDASYLMTPHIPYPLDYHQTLLSLLDVISEVYNKISKILGPSPFSQHSQQMVGPLGLLSPHPGVSYLFASDNSTLNANPYGSASTNSQSTPSINQPQPQMGEEPNGSLWGIANGGSIGTMMSGMGSPPPGGWTPALGDMILKVDGKFKKMTSTLLKELDNLARNGIKDELASLDPLLRNIKVPEEHRGIGYDFEGM